MAVFLHRQAFFFIIAGNDDANIIFYGGQIVHEGVLLS
jgi:hypothetical protein